MLSSTRGVNLCWALGEIICNFTPIFPYFQHWRDEPRPRFFWGEQIKWRPKKKKVFIKNRTLFSANSSGHLRSDVHQSQIIGGDANEDHTQIIGGMQMKTILRLLGGYSQIIGGYISLSRRVLASLSGTEYKIQRLKSNFSVGFWEAAQELVHY